MSSDAKKGRYFTFLGYPESLPDAYITTLNLLGVGWARSPLHDKDLDPTGNPKKAHYHFIIAFKNPVTFQSVERLVCTQLNQPIPKILVSPVGMYRYFTHMDNPDKFQYDSKDIFTVNFSIGDYCKLNSYEEQLLIFEVMDYIRDNHITNYASLCFKYKDEDSNLFDIVMHNTFFFKSLCDSMRYRKK